MIAVVRLAAVDLARRWRLALATILMLAVPVGALVVLDAFERGIAADFRSEADPDLIVQESNSIGEIAGSRLPVSVAGDLEARGVSFAIPEIHTVAGTSSEDAVLLRGIDVERFGTVTQFDVLAGRSLRSSDAPEAVMIGAYLADRRGLAPGDDIEIRGERFEVVGVFSVGTFADSEAWMELSRAQELLGWGTDVSIFIIPDEGVLTAGDMLARTISVAPRGDFGDALDEWGFVLGLLRLAALTMAVAAAMILATVLWRIAWSRRRDLATVRILGFGRSIQTAFLAVQGATITFIGVAGGIVVGVAATALFRFEAFGFTTTAIFDGMTIVRGVGLAAGIATLSTGLAAAALRRLSPAQLMRTE